MSDRESPPRIVAVCPRCGYSGWETARRCQFCGLKRNWWTSLQGKARAMFGDNAFDHNFEPTPRQRKLAREQAAPRTSRKAYLAAGAVLAVVGAVFFATLPGSDHNESDTAPVADVPPEPLESTSRPADVAAAQEPSAAPSEPSDSSVAPSSTENTPAPTLSSDATDSGAQQPLADKPTVDPAPPRTNPLPAAEIADTAEGGEDPGDSGPVVAGPIVTGPAVTQPAIDVPSTGVPVDDAAPATVPPEVASATDAPNTDSSSDPNSLTRPPGSSSDVNQASPTESKDDADMKSNTVRLVPPRLDTDNQQPQQPQLVAPDVTQPALVNKPLPPELPQPAVSDPVTASRTNDQPDSPQPELPAATDQKEPVQAVTVQTEPGQATTAASEAKAAETLPLIRVTPTRSTRGRRLQLEIARP